MAKKSPPRGKCVQCLRDPVERTWDHVFPKSWYPDNIPPNLWTVPNCRECNQQLGQMEYDLLVRLGHVLDPHHRASSGLYDRARRAIDPSAARDDKDRRMREAARERFLNELWVGDEIPDHGHYPLLGDRFDQPDHEKIAVPFPKVGIERITEKIVRGITYIEDNAFIEPPYQVQVYVLTEEGAAPIQEILKRGTEHARGEGIVVKRIVAADDPRSSFFELHFWQQFYSHASVTIPEAER